MNKDEARIDEVVKNEQLHHRNGIVDIPFDGTSVPMQGVTIHLSDTPLTIRKPLPQVGEHNADVLTGWLGYAAGQVEKLQASGAI